MSLSFDLCCFNSLNDDVLHRIHQFAGEKSYVSFGLSNKICNEMYVKYDIPKETYIGYAPLKTILSYVNKTKDGIYIHRGVGKAAVYYNRTDLLNWSLENKDEYILRGILYTASREGRQDILEKIFNHVNDEGALSGLKSVNEFCTAAARSGRLDTLRFLQSKGSPCSDWAYAWARKEGHLDVMEYLSKDGCPENANWMFDCINEKSIWS